MKIMIDRQEYIPTGEKPQMDHAEMWYDRHYSHWVIYPVDKDGTQIAEAQYGFGKQEALRIKAEIEGRISA